MKMYKSMYLLVIKLEAVYYLYSLMESLFHVDANDDSHYLSRPTIFAVCILVSQIVACQRPLKGCHDRE